MKSDLRNSKALLPKALSIDCPRLMEDLFGDAAQVLKTYELDTSRRMTFAEVLSIFSLEDMFFVRPSAVSA